MTQLIVDLHIRISEVLRDEIRKAAEEKGLSISGLVGSAVQEYLSDQRGLDEKSARAKLIRLERSFKGLRSDIEVLLEVILHFVFQWFCYTPALGDSDKDAVLIEARERYNRFVAILKRRLESGEYRSDGVLSNRMNEMKSLNGTEVKGQ